MEPQNSFQSMEERRKQNISRNQQYLAEILQLDSDKVTGKSAVASVEADDASPNGTSDCQRHLAPLLQHKDTIISKYPQRKAEIGLIYSYFNSISKVIVLTLYLSMPQLI